MKLSSENLQVAAVRPIRFSQDSMIFELRDGRVSRRQSNLVT